MVLGSLLKAIQKARLWPFPEPPYKGFTVEGLKSGILAAEIHTLCDITDPKRGLKVHKGQAPSQLDNDNNNNLRYLQSRYNQGSGQVLMASWTIKESIASTINSLSKKLCGLNIEDFK
jgi:hypothetical protein